jgi:hypothetical protein
VFIRVRLFTDRSPSASREAVSMVASVPPRQRAATLTCSAEVISCTTRSACSRPSRR